MDKLLEKNVDPIRVLYLPCDMIKDNEELANVLIFYKKSFDFKKKNSFIFLDETTTVPEWQRAIKFLVDSGIVSDDLVVLTGSSAKSIEMRHKIEMIILRHLFKKREISMFGLDLVKGPYFWYSDKGKEIDFVVDTKTALLPLEVKYQNTVSPGDYVGMKKVFGSGIVITKNTIFKDEDVIGIPAWLFVSLVK
ncbi:MULTISPECIES: AAA family ATPase [unclassified Thermosipho (in: thermotogales)]|uniref:AAA family ATPase n=1 Tax=unclassified Thermosipho (in: thermotogales) TaxID=2676525 RepID=UPI0009492EF3|nr:MULTISPECIES: AAA family ATPase [unclassified Thermosipho (in: thermotogales)]ANQ54581.1 hypothetical protein Y592_03405 [Thermosipho sp. 1070]OOC44762.1 hypothetical protein XO08_03355 [Thermosipho sp. 1074]